MAAFRTGLLLLHRVGDGGAGEGRQGGRVRRAEPRHAAQQQLVQTLGRLALLAGQDDPFLQDVRHAQPRVGLGGGTRGRRRR